MRVYFKMLVGMFPVMLAHRQIILTNIAQNLVGPSPVLLMIWLSLVKECACFRRFGGPKSDTSMFMPQARMWLFAPQSMPTFHWWGQV